MQEVLTTAEAAEFLKQFNIDVTAQAIKKAAQRGRFGNEVRKAGRDWIITKRGLKRFYKVKEPNNI